MSAQILSAVLLAVLAYLLLLFVWNRFVKGSDGAAAASIVGTSGPTEEAFIAPAPPVTQPIPKPPRVVAPSGPNPPNQAPPLDEPAVRLPPPGDYDPQRDDYGSSDVSDNMRYPERLFGPAPEPNNTEIAVGSGVASPLQQTVSQAIQTFSPDFAQNGGEFINGGIFANDTYENPNYSAF